MNLEKVNGFLDFMEDESGKGNRDFVQGMGNLPIIYCSMMIPMQAAVEAINTQYRPEG